LGPGHRNTIVAAVTILVDPVGVDLDRGRMDRGLRVIAVVTATKQSVVAVCVPIAGQRRVRPIAVLVDAIFGHVDRSRRGSRRWVDPIIIVVAVLASASGGVHPVEVDVAEVPAGAILVDRVVRNLAGARMNGRVFRLTIQGVRVPVAIGIRKHRRSGARCQEEKEERDDHRSHGTPRRPSEDA
jgi:hypothetical protein